MLSLRCDQKPDRKEYDDGVVDHFYDRSVLVLYRKEDKTKILLSIKGIDWGFKELESASNRFTAHARKAAFTVLWELQESAKQNHQSKAACEIGNTLQVFPFQAIQPGISGLIERTSKLQQCYNIIKTIVSSAGTNATAEWGDALRNSALSS
ncbi:hypothetical protein EST38_g9106 [Candolleomyces aberdarensis]|uniref:Uncharacterized protein n=1 Tax=Candolleomyces aberdarensis TaxID=2316362 RepID=A0A4Q2DCK2_9AGAR|nr:hypothetical protein EST38_g9106 [Candolleomyces aberdarensis]